MAEARIGSFLVQSRVQSFDDGPAASSNFFPIDRSPLGIQLQGPKPGKHDPRRTMTPGHCESASPLAAFLLAKIGPVSSGFVEEGPFVVEGTSRLFDPLRLSEISAEFQKGETKATGPMG